MCRSCVVSQVFIPPSPSWKSFFVDKAFEYFHFTRLVFQVFHPYFVKLKAQGTAYMGFLNTCVSYGTRCYELDIDDAQYLAPSIQFLKPRRVVTYEELRPLPANIVKVVSVSS